MRQAHEKYSAESPVAARRAGVLLKESSQVDPLLQLQQAVGNQAVLRLLRGGYGQGKTLQKKCARCSTGATCSKCSDEEDLQSPQLPVHARARQAPTVEGRTETLGKAWCDLDQGKMLWEIRKDKIPECMWHCAEAHEKAHAQFGRGECSKLTVFYNKVKQLDAQADRVRAAAEKDPSKANVAKAVDLTNKIRKANEDLRKAIDAYKKWVERTCREDEKKAYQADINACTGPKVEKRCADMNQTERYKDLMKDAKEFKNKPPNCK